MQRKIKGLLLSQFVFNMLLFFLTLALNDAFEGQFFLGIPLLLICWIGLTLVMTFTILLVGVILLKKYNISK